MVHNTVNTFMWKVFFSRQFEKVSKVQRYFGLDDMFKYIFSPKQNVQIYSRVQEKLIDGAWLGYTDCPNWRSLIGSATSYQE